jgi:hypothetical protein
MTTCTHQHPVFDPERGLIVSGQCHRPAFIKVNGKDCCHQHADAMLRNVKK